MMSPDVLVMQVIAGGLLGMLGQGVRVIAGLKKVHDSASQQNQALQDVFDLHSLVISLFIGFTAGALALLAASGFSADFNIDKSTGSALIAAGYAGTDFIEAFMKKYLPGGAGTAQGSTAAPDVQPTKAKPTPASGSQAQEPADNRNAIIDLHANRNHGDESYRPLQTGERW